MEMENNKILENEQPEIQEQSAPQDAVYEPPVTYEYEPKPLFEMDKGDTAFAVLSVLACVFTSVFGIFGGMALGYALSVIITLAVFAVYFLKGARKGFSTIVYGLLALFNSAIFVCTSNPSVRFFGSIVTLLLALVCFDGLQNGSSKGNRETFGVLYSMFSSFGNIGVTFKSLFTNQKGDKRVVGKALLGLACAMPVLFVVVPLLISSDYAFQGMMKNIFSNTFSTIFKSIFGVSVAVFVVSYGLSLKKDRTSRIRPSSFSGIENVYVVSFLSSISIFYLLYLFSQLAYFFSAFKGFLPEGDINYSEYARKGFFEMCVIAVINLVIVFLALILSKKKNGKVCGLVKAIATFISLFTLIIIATAISKMVLYIDTYGMTVLRLTTSAFMVFLSVVFISVILRIYTVKINVVKTALITAGCIILVLGTVNVNAVCARYNYESYKSKRLETIDVNALYELGDEGIPYIVKLTDDYHSDVVKEAKHYLARAYLEEYFEDMSDIKYITVDVLKENRKDKSFARFSIPRNEAYESLYDYIEKDSGFVKSCRLYLEDTEVLW